MSKVCQEDSASNFGRWDEAIQDAESKLERVSERVVRLKAAIETFRRAKERGQPWPGESATHD
jgi:hypothetical protein